MEGKYNPVTMKKAIQDMLLELGVPCSLKGYRALEIGLSMAVENPDIVDSMTWEFYPSVATQMGGTNTGSKVERCMRHAVETAFDNVKPDVLYGYFGNTVAAKKGKPTNKQFVAMVAQQVRNRLEVAENV